MIVKYMDCEYKYISNRRYRYIITSQKEKAKDGFAFKNGIYWKAVEEKDLTDIYAVKFWVKYKSGFKGVSDWWILSNEKNVIKNNKVKLVFAEGVLPNWEIIDKNVCSALIPLSEIIETKVVTCYKKRDGFVLDERLCEERTISTKELKDMLFHYNVNSL